MNRPCPVCAAVTGDTVPAHRITPRGYHCCDEHADLVTTMGLIQAVVAVKHRARRLKEPA